MEQSKTTTEITLDDRIRTGMLPSILEGADWRRYSGSRKHSSDWQGFCEAWRGIAWARYQAFEREAEAEEAAKDWAQ